MPRRPEIPHTPADQVLKVRFTPPDIAGLDQVRGKTPRSTWVRDLVRTHLPGVQTSAPVRRQPSSGDPAADDGVTPVKAPRDTPHAPSEPPTVSHRHTPGKLLSEVGLKGTVVRTYRCAEEGCGKELTR